MRPAQPRPKLVKSQVRTAWWICEIGLTTVAEMAKTARFLVSYMLYVSFDYTHALFVTWLTFIWSGGIQMRCNVSKEDRLLTLPVC